MEKYMKKCNNCEHDCHCGNHWCGECERTDKQPLCTECNCSESSIKSE